MISNPLPFYNGTNFLLISSLALIPSRLLTILHSVNLFISFLQTTATRRLKNWPKIASDRLKTAYFTATFWATML